MGLSVFKGQRVLLTGDTGFKGSWLATWLNNLGADVMGIGLPAETPSHHFSRLGLARRIKHVDVDIRVSADVTREVREFQPTFLFHLAAQPLVRTSYADPQRTFEVNVGGTVNVLEAARLCPSLRVLVFVSTDKCYRNREWVWGYRETDELGGTDPYSASKAAAEHALNSYSESFFKKRADFGVASVRAGNVIGGGDWSLDRIVPDCIRALTESRPIVLRSPDAVRPFQHVLDALHGYLILAAKLYDDPAKYAGSWNFGPEATTGSTVRSLANTLASYWPAGRVEVAPEAERPREAEVLKIAIDKARDHLGWRPLWSFERAVAETARWYREVQEGSDVMQLTLSQIAAHQESPTPP